MMELPAARFRHPLKRPRRIPPPPPPPLLLVAAAYSEGLWVRLTFDRPVNIAAMNVAAVVVDDADVGDRFRGTGTPTLFAPATVQVGVASVGPTPAVDTRLTAGPDTRLAAADEGGTWAGVTDLVLPYP